MILTSLAIGLGIKAASAKGTVAAHAALAAHVTSGHAVATGIGLGVVAVGATIGGSTLRAVYNRYMSEEQEKVRTRRRLPISESERLDLVDSAYDNTRRALALKGHLTAEVEADLDRTRAALALAA